MWPTVRNTFQSNLIEKFPSVTKDTVIASKVVAGETLTFAINPTLIGATPWNTSQLSCVVDLILVTVSASALDTDEASSADTFTSFEVPLFGNAAPWKACSVVGVVQLSVAASTAFSIDELVSKRANTNSKIIVVGLNQGAGWSAFSYS